MPTGSRHELPPRRRRETHLVEVTTGFSSAYPVGQAFACHEI